MILFKFQISFSVKRKRREFGAYVKFSDRNVADSKDAYQECTPYEDTSFGMKTIELSKATQVTCNLTPIEIIN